MTKLIDNSSTENRNYNYIRIQFKKTILVCCVNFPRLMQGGGFWFGTHTANSISNLVTSNQTWIVITLFQ